MGEVTKKTLTKTWHQVKECQALLFIRHAERPALPEGDFGLNLALTPQGAANANKLGRFIGSLEDVVPGDFHSSPYRRCKDTVTEILKGAEWRQPAIVQPDLTGGSLIFDCENYTEEDVINTICGHGDGIAGVLNDLILRGQHQPGFRPFPVGVRRFLGFVIHLLDETRGPSLSVACGHDSEIAQAMAYCFGAQEFGQKHWPSFLEGILFWKTTDGNIWAAYDDSVSQLQEI